MVDAKYVPKYGCTLELTRIWQTIVGNSSSQAHINAVRLKIPANSMLSEVRHHIHQPLQAIP